MPFAADFYLLEDGDTGKVIVYCHRKVTFSFQHMQIMHIIQLFVFAILHHSKCDLSFFSYNIRVALYQKYAPTAVPYGMVGFAFYFDSEIKGAGLSRKSLGLCSTVCTITHKKKHMRVPM